MTPTTNPTVTIAEADLSPIVLPEPGALDALYDATVTAARAGYAPKLTLHGATQLAALRAWADRRGFAIASDRMSGIARRVAVQWDLDEVELPSGGRISVHGDDEPVRGGGQ